MTDLARIAILVVGLVSAGTAYARGIVLEDTPAGTRWKRDASGSPF